MNITIKNNKESTFALRLKQVMNEQHLTQIDVINKCKPYCDKYDVTISKGSLSLYLSGQREPRQDRLYILSLALGVSEAWLMGYSVPQERTTSTSLNIPENTLFTQVVTNENTFSNDQLAFLDVDETIIIREYRQFSDQNKRLLFGLFISAMQSVNDNPNNTNKINECINLIRHSKNNITKLNVTPSHLIVSRKDSASRQKAFEEVREKIALQKPKPTLLNKPVRYVKKKEVKNEA